jgi:sirohydrochlorin cobaltochelatase
VTASPEREWIVLLAHGSADVRWRQPFVELRDRLRARDPERGVALAYLQFCEPTLAQTLRACAARGARRVLVVPAFMSGGGHLLRDVSGTVAAATATLPELVVRCSGALGEAPEVREAMATACARLVGGQVL